MGRGHVYFYPPLCSVELCGASSPTTSSPCLRKGTHVTLSTWANSPVVLWREQQKYQQEIFNFWTHTTSTGTQSVAPQRLRGPAPPPRRRQPGGLQAQRGR